VSVWAGGKNVGREILMCGGKKKSLLVKKTKGEDGAGQALPSLISGEGGKRKKGIEMRNAREGIGTGETGRSTSAEERTALKRLGRVFQAKNEKPKGGMEETETRRGTGSEQEEGLQAGKVAHHHRED